MIAKKNPKVDLERKRAAIFNLGLLVAGSFTLAAFTYTESFTTEAEKLAVDVEEIVVFELEEKKEEVKTETPSRPQSMPQQPQQPQNLGSQTGLSEVVNASANPLTGPKKSDGPGAFGITVPFIPPVMDDGRIEPLPKIDAKYDGGYIAMMEKINSVQDYPEIDVELGNQGVVNVSFIVEKDGSITGITIDRGVSETLDREAVRIVRSFPKWIPGEDSYGVVRTRVRLPIKFLLRD
jgi:periplasmic protein TonB